MPEGPELYITALSINKICRRVIFTGAVARNPIHKCEAVDWDQPAYEITAEARGKELMLRLQTVSDDDHTLIGSSQVNEQSMKTTSILFTFGMSGQFAFTPAKELHKHSHLTFFSRSEPSMALSFVDTRRFGRWLQGGHWSPGRGPCVIQEYDSFVHNIVSNLNCPELNKPICEVLLNQRLFSGIGNYLRAEILFRCQIPPFVKASSVLRLRDKAELHVTHSQISECVPDSRTQVPELVRDSHSCIDVLTPEAQELLRLCHLVPLEVVHLGSSKYIVSDPGQDGEVGSFEDWLQCYNQATMTSLTDHNKRTIWFSGAAGPMVPADQNPRRSESSKKRRQPVKANIETVDDSSKDIRGTTQTLSDRTLTREVLTDKAGTGRTKRTSKVRKHHEIVEESSDFVISTARKRPHPSANGMNAIKNGKVKLTGAGNGPFIARITRSTVSRTKVI